MKIYWWGYLHTNGSIQAKRFFSQQDITEAGESPFVVKVYGPFVCDSREKAVKQLEEVLK